MPCSADTDGFIRGDARCKNRVHETKDPAAAKKVSGVLGQSCKACPPGSDDPDPYALTLLTSGDDGTVRFWHVATGLELLVLENCAFDQFTRRIPNSGDDGILLYDGAGIGVDMHAPRFTWWPTPSLAEIDREIQEQHPSSGRSEESGRTSH